MITIEKLRNGNFLIEGERDEMNTLKYQVYMFSEFSDNRFEMYEWEEELINILKSHNSFEHIELPENQLNSLYKFLENIEKEFNQFDVFKENNEKLKKALINSPMIKRYFAIKKLKNNIKEKC